MVFDTNVLIDGFQDDFSAQARLVETVRDGELQAAVTPAVVREYKKILHRLIQDARYQDEIEDFLFMATEVQPVKVDITVDDKEDMKFIEAAVGGQVDALVTNDKHLLDIGEIDTIKIVTPQEAWQWYDNETGGRSEWENFITGIGLKK